MAHLAVAVKVNGWADEEVAPLVVALNGLAEVVSLDSCQDSRDIGGAYVMFVSGDAELPTARLVERLAIDLAKRLRDVPYRLRLEWFAGGDDPVGYLVSPPEFIGTLVRVVGEVATAWNTVREALATSGYTRTVIGTLVRVVGVELWQTP
jgi:hypothetical protein